MAAVEAPTDCVQISLSLDRSWFAASDESVELVLMSKLLDKCLGSIKIGLTQPSSPLQPFSPTPPPPVFSSVNHISNKRPIRFKMPFNPRTAKRRKILKPIKQELHVRTDMSPTDYPLGSPPSFAPSQTQEPSNTIRELPAGDCDAIERYLQMAAQQMNDPNHQLESSAAADESATDDNLADSGYSGSAAAERQDATVDIMTTDSEDLSSALCPEDIFRLTSPDKMPAAAAAVHGQINVTNFIPDLKVPNRGRRGKASPSEDGGSPLMQCELCSFKTAYSSNLNTHMKNIHCSLKPYKCELCSFHCKVKSSLKRHYLCVHKLPASVISGFIGCFAQPATG